MIKISAMDLSCIATMAKLFLEGKDTEKAFKKEDKLTRKFLCELYNMNEDLDETLYIITNPFKD